MTKYSGMMVAFGFLLFGCYESEVSCPAPRPVLVDAADILVDAGTDAAPSDSPCPVNPYLREDDFTVHVLTPVIELRPGTETTIMVCVQRGARFEEPVLLRNTWAPDSVHVEVRENRPEDIDGITVLRVRVNPVEEDPTSPGSYRAPRMSFFAGSGFDLATTFTVDFTVGPAER